MNYEDKTKELVLKFITEAKPSIPASMLSFRLEDECGEIVFPDDVDEICNELRLDGHLIIEVADGYRLAESYAEVRAWHQASIGQRLERLHRICEAMEQNAFEKFLSDS